ncbi:arylsulfatase [Streptomyces sp. HB2AG]|uniref:arylsulfatase n=1 Tax=Streptomyces sp. HB2AG TaxID=2983400 RepID=UPI0022AA26B9|nr:arylsulfatase [Streptomyces sp. HB2AG]MCZ2524593.1 arylsulfatase [Streptomyces sp. HB2AG]
MAVPFRGVIQQDIRDSVPDWEPYRQPQAPEGAPNVLYLVWDDIGFGTFDVFGGLVEAPAMRRIADMGVRFTNFHTTALCSPTRASLLTGRNATSNGMACVAEATSGFPGSSGRIPFENGNLAEVLVERGWNTYAVGKWHLCPAEEANMASSKRLWPLGRGFERFYGFLSGETDQYYPNLVHDNHPVEPPYGPEQGYHLSKDLTDRAVQFIRDAKVIAPEKPWFTYFCPSAGHAPHHVFKEWADRYAGTFDDGYEVYRRMTLRRQIELGIMPEGTELTPINPHGEPDAAGPSGQPWPAGEFVRPWESLNDDEKRLFTRMAEVFAGFVSYTDAQIGRLLDYLEESGQLENTVVVAVSDNGASAEGGPNGSVNEMNFFNGVPDDLAENLRRLDELGSPTTYNHYPTGWAWAFNTPFKYWKRWVSYEGGIADPMIIAWPRGIAARGEVRHQYLHAVDIVPTLYDLLGIRPPALVKGVAQSPLEGVSFRRVLEDAQAPDPKQTQFYTMLGTRGIWHDGWHAATVHPPTPSGWSRFDQDTWELYNLREDRSGNRDLAGEHPEKLEELKRLWSQEAEKYHGLPLDDRSAVEILATPRPQLTEPRNRYVYYPGCADVPESVAVNIRGRSYAVVADIRLDTTEAHGVLFAHGGRFGGHSLYLKDGHLHYVYNWLGRVEQRISSPEPVGTGELTLSAAFRAGERDEQGSTHGTLALHVGDRQVAEADIKTQPGMFSPVGEGLAVGRDSGQPVSSDYDSPFEFLGGTIREVVVDVSGEPFVDLEKEFIAMFHRD